MQSDDPVVREWETQYLRRFGVVATWVGLPAALLSPLVVIVVIVMWGERLGISWGFFTASLFHLAGMALWLGYARVSKVCLSRWKLGRFWRLSVLFNGVWFLFIPLGLAQGVHSPFDLFIWMFWWLYTLMQLIISIAAMRKVEGW